MQKLWNTLLIVALASCSFGAATDPTKTLRLESNEAHKTVRLEIHEGDTPLVRCYLYQNGEAWTLDGTETATFAYSVEDWDDATNMVSIAGTVGANAYVDFQFDGDDTATNGQFYGEIQISDDSPSRSWVWSELRLGIRKSPIGSSGALTLNNPVNWNNTGPYSGTWPIYGGSNVTVSGTSTGITINASVTGGSGDITAVNITAGTGMTGTVNTASGDHDQTLALNAASVASLALADSALQAESDPSNAVHIADAVGAHAATAVSTVEDGYALISGTNVQDSLDSADAQIGAVKTTADSALQTESDPSNAVHIADSVGAHAASAVSTTGTYSTVQAGIEGNETLINTVYTNFTAGLGLEELNAPPPNTGRTLTVSIDLDIVSTNTSVIEAGANMTVSPSTTNNVTTYTVASTGGGGSGGFPVTLEEWYDAELQDPSAAPHRAWSDGGGNTVYARALESTNTVNLSFDFRIVTGAVVDVTSPLAWETGTNNTASVICNIYYAYDDTVQASVTNTTAALPTLATATQGEETIVDSWTNTVGTGFYRFVFDKGDSVVAYGELGFMGAPTITVTEP